jgi:hypothetical protein
MRHRLRYCFIRFRWLTVRLGTPVGTGDPSEAIPGLVIADILKPRPTS